MLSFVAIRREVEDGKAKHSTHTKQNIHVASYSHSSVHPSPRACLYPMQATNLATDRPTRPFSTTNLQVNKSKHKQDKWYPHATSKDVHNSNQNAQTHTIITPSYNSTTSDTPHPLLPLPHTPPSPLPPPAPGCQRPTSTPRARPFPHSPPRRAPQRGSSPQTP